MSLSFAKEEVTPATTKFWHHMYGLQQVDMNTSVVSTTISSYEATTSQLTYQQFHSAWHRSAAWWPISEVIQKLISFTQNRTKVWHFPSGQLPDMWLSMLPPQTLCCNITVCTNNRWMRTLPIYQWGTPGVLCLSEPVWKKAQDKFSVMEDINMGRTAPPTVNVWTLAHGLSISVKWFKCQGHCDILKCQGYMTFHKCQGYDLCS